LRSKGAGAAPFRLARARGSASAPWDAREFDGWRAVLPQMSRCPPDKQRAGRPAREIGERAPGLAAIEGEAAAGSSSGRRRAPSSSPTSEIAATV